MDLSRTSAALWVRSVECCCALLCKDCAWEGLGGDRDYFRSDLDLVVFPPTVTLSFRPVEAIVVHDAVVHSAQVMRT
jgi:hypothetical protein